MSEQKEEGQSTLKDRLNYPYFIGDAILTCNKSVLSEGEYSERETIEATKNLRSLIPTTWEDQKFKNDLEDAKIMRKKDVRPIVAGNVRMSEEACKQLGIQTFKENKTFDYEKLRRACINLLDRIGMTTKINPVQELEGIDFGKIEEDAIRKGDISRK